MFVKNLLWMFYLTFKIYVTVFTSIPLKALAH
jgi:hypothetical protein